MGKKTRLRISVNISEQGEHRVYYMAIRCILLSILMEMFLLPLFHRKEVPVLPYSVMCGGGEA